ncbi:uncharacterized protein LOC110979860 [Acanthaster planci]|uniref:E3 ubiquitin-protein ligase n=1 Tax=Acanthaster planci TaxID=133434 RepID=A0A8B7YEJ7_ACAPL|nr:uncharacterized protein LOC110979860 [Acanthaster planci]
MHCAHSLTRSGLETSRITKNQCRDCLDSKMDPSELFERALLVQNLRSVEEFRRLSEDQQRDKLIIHFQNRGINHGGDIKDVIYPLNSAKNSAIVIFEEAKDRESAVQHKHVFHSQPLEVCRLPLVFTSIEAKIDPLYLSLMPREAAYTFPSRLQNIAGVEVNPNNLSEIRCSHLTQLDNVAREVFWQIFQHKMAVGNEFQAASASIVTHEPTYYQHRGLDGFRGASGNHGEVSEREMFNTADPNPSSKQTEDPEEFFNAESISNPHMPTVDGNGDRDKQFNSPSALKTKEGQKEDVGDEVKSGQDIGVIVDKYKYKYLQSFQEKDLNELSKQYNVKFKVSLKKKEDSPKVFVVASDSKGLRHVQQATDEFISFYQKASYDVQRKTIDCSTAPSKSVDEAVKQTQKLFKSDTLIIKDDGFPSNRIILRRGDVEEVARRFREIAGIKSRRKLLTTAANRAGSEDDLKGKAEPQMTGAQFLRSPIKNEMLTELQHLPSASQHSPFHGTANPPVDTRADLMKFVTNEGLNILVLEGDITKQDVLAIVNPSTVNLQNTGGVAKAIVLAAGPELERVCWEFRQKRHLKVTECETTPGFNLKCSIIHAAGPISRHQSFTSELYLTFLNCLHEAEKHKFSSLAIPLVGSGSAGAQKKVCADVLVQALLDFSGEPSKPKVVSIVLLVNIDRESTAEIYHSLQTAFNAQHKAGILSRAPTGPGPSHFASLDMRGPGLAYQMQGTPLGTQIDSCQTDEYNKDWPKPGESRELGKQDQQGIGGSDSKEAYGNRKPSQDARPAGKATGADSAPARPSDTKVDSSADGKNGGCPICLADEMKDEVALMCKHRFCKGCIEEAFKRSYKCPICQAVCRPPKGNQPPGGTMRHTTDQYMHLPGHENHGVITIHYSIPRGTQSADHPNPGRYFTGTSRTAYLPDNPEGREVLRLLQKAFDAGLVFTVGQSNTTGFSDTVTWNDIHHKTCQSGGPSNFGYPDPGYLKRVKEELSAKGIA